jgi:hypothetical protein
VKNVDLLHDNAQPHTSLHTHKAIAKMGWIVLPHAGHSPDLVPSGYHLFGSVKDALHGHHSVDDSKLKQSFHDVFQSQGREF